MTAFDALVDPHITIRHEKVMPQKDPGYLDLAKRDTVRQDKVSRVIHDYTGRPMIKVDQEGGIFDNQLKKEPLSPRLRKSGNDQVYHGPGLYGGLSIKPTNRQLFNNLPSAKPNEGPLTEADNLTKKGLMQRKLYLMKLMLRNEQKANSVIKQKIQSIGTEMH